MRVDPKDGHCRECGGDLEITDFDDCSLTVLCLNPDCGDSYPVETDAFGDGCLKYHFPLVLEQRLRGER
jgi:putative hemolysin